MRKKPSTPAMPAASPEGLQKAHTALGDRPQTPMERIEADKKFLAEMPKQIRTREQTERYFEEQATKLIKEQEENARRNTLAKAAASDDSKESKPKRIYYDLGSIDYHLGDEDPITKVAGFNVPDSALRFQKCQFDPNFKRSGSGGVKTVKWTDEYALGTIQVVQSSLNTVVPYSTAAGSMISSQNENQVKQGPAKGLMMMDEYFNFIGEPRKADEESAWIRDDLRFRDFIIRQVEEEDVDWYGENPNAPLEDIAWRFGRSLKTYFGLYHFFRANMSDKEISDAEGVTIPAGLWRKGSDRTDIAARTKDRARMMAAGFELYGCGPVGKALDPDTVTRSLYFWPFFQEIQKEVARCQESEDTAGGEESNEESEE